MPAIVCLTVLTACAEDTGGARDDRSADAAAATTSSPETDPATGQADGELTITVDRGDGGPVEEHTLVCADEARGTLPDPQDVCGHLASLAAPFAPLPADAVCTEQYGGPQTARVTGRWAGQPVDLSLSRTDGCRIAQWDALGGLLPGS